MIVKQSGQQLSGGLDFILSDNTVDRYGDVIEAAGWDLASFKKNPIALFGHSSSFPIGVWENLRIDGNKLVGRLKLAARGTSHRIDEIIALVEQGILRAVSVGFRPIDGEEMKGGGVRYRAQELLETSLVTVPANPNAVQIAKSLHISAETMALVFGENADGTAKPGVQRKSGENAVLPTKSHSRKSPMNMTLAQRIEAAESDLVNIKSQLDEQIADENADSDVLDGLTVEIEQRQVRVDSLKRAENALKAKSEPVNKDGEIQRRPFAEVAVKVAPKDLMIRSAAIKLVAHVTRAAPQEVLHKLYGNHEETRVVFDHVQRAATAPAMTTTSGWASQLVETVNADFMETLVPNSVYPGLSSRGLRLNFGRAGSISIPSRSATPTIAGSFVAEGSPIPVRQGAFTSQTLTPKKMAVISTFTREIATHSTPAIEGLIRDAIQEDTSAALDTVLLDATAASTTRPAGLRNGVTVTTATTGGGFAALVGDITGLVTALITATSGNLRAPVWIMNPADVLTIGLTQNAGGDFPFAAETQAGNLRGYPIVTSPTVTAGMVFLVDAADFVSVTGDEPMFDVSDQATLHMEDTTPLAIGTAGSPNTVAAPVRSMFQTDSIALRMILPMNWAMRRSSIAWTQSVTW